MSPSQRKRPTSGRGKGPGRPGGGKSGSGSGAGKGPTPREAARRLGLLLFGSVLVVLFIVLAVAEGVGDPSIPSGDVALVENVPGDGGHISEGDFNHTLDLVAAEMKKKTPKPGDDEYDEVMEKAMGNLLNAAWLEGEAEELGISVSEKEVEKEFKKVKGEAFKTEAEYKKFLKEAHYTKADVLDRVKLQMLTEQVEEKVAKSAPKPSESEVKDYYEASKSTQYVKPASRNVRVILNKDKAKVEAAKKELEKDSSEASWQKVAKKYSTESLSKDSGGLRTELTEATADEPLKTDAFTAPEGELEGPVKGPKGFYLFEVVSEKPESTQSLDEVKSSISAQLEGQLQQSYFAEFVADFSSKWTSRTFCADGFVIETCSNFKSNGHPSEADPTCYEPSAKGGVAKECPAPVIQTKPAFPGSVDVLTPEGERLVQRPRPVGLEEGEEASSTLEGIPGVPPTSP
ncbi:MAG TPA: peptidyl-prolyl cis-trans isomerase [Solirubrobacterales bacterium]|nr:peptidyl-prolyl cis-trans isomerase [Solirubrobacterales bacterium]